jgi:hypothetical protein
MRKLIDDLVEIETLRFLMRRIVFERIRIHVRAILGGVEHDRVVDGAKVVERLE